MTAEPRPGSGTPDADDGHTINVGPVTVADPGSGTPDPTPNGQTWACVVPMSVRFRTCTEAKAHASCRTYNEEQRRPVPPAPTSTPESVPEPRCPDCNGSGWYDGDLRCPNGCPVPAAASSPDEGASEDRCARDACPVWDGGDCGGCYLTPRPASADEGARQRPGGWVDGIGWVALLADLNGDDLAAVHPGGQSCRAGGVWASSAHPVVVVRWADGTTPAPPAPSTPAPQPETVCDCCGAHRVIGWAGVCEPCWTYINAMPLPATPPSTPAEPEPDAAPTDGEP